MPNRKRGHKKPSPSDRKPLLEWTDEQLDEAESYDDSFWEGSNTE